jgi:hypothetical protein
VQFLFWKTKIRFMGKFPTGKQSGPFPIFARLTLPEEFLWKKLNNSSEGIPLGKT